MVIVILSALAGYAALGILLLAFFVAAGCAAYALSRHNVSVHPDGSTQRPSRAPILQQCPITG